MGACANCGAALDGPYCARCGQSTDELSRPVFALFTDWLDGIFTWDGRLLATLRALFLRPGAVARDYLDGKRARFTPPMRLYLLTSLMFFAAMAALHVRVIALDLSITRVEPAASAPASEPAPDQEDADSGSPSATIGAMVDTEDTSFARFDSGPLADPETKDDGSYAASLTMSAFTRAAPSRPELTPDVLERTQALMADANVPGIVLLAMREPDLVERRMNAAASQAVIAIVIAFALLNLLLHPRARLIGHVIHSLYFHATLMPLLALWIGLWATVRVGPLVGVGAAIAGLALFAVMMLAFDRGFYRSSWLGLALRAPVLVFGYLLAFVNVALGLGFLSLPR